MFHSVTQPPTQTVPRPGGRWTEKKKEEAKVAGLEVRLREDTVVSEYCVVQVYFIGCNNWDEGNKTSHQELNPAGMMDMEGSADGTGCMLQYLLHTPTDGLQIKP